jgi:hypothetical protein
MVQLRSRCSVIFYFEIIEFKNKLVSAEYFEMAPKTMSGHNLCKNQLLTVDGLEEPIASCFTPN